EHRVAETDRNAMLGGKPSGAHDVGHLAVDVENIDASRLEQLALAAQVQILAGIDMHPGGAGADLAKPVKIIAKARILRPQDVKAGAPIGIKSTYCFARRP